MRTFTGIEIARGIAACMVMVSHYALFVTHNETFFHFLWTGVDLFFVISGFVFANAILSKEVNLRYFFIRRVFRIYPLYLIALVIYYFLTVDSPLKLDYFINHLYFFQTLSSREEAIFFNAAFWSLPVEMEFYILVPLFALLMRSKHFLFKLLLFSFLMKSFIGYMLLENNQDILYLILSYHITNFLIEFIIGIYLYKLVLKHQEQKLSPVFYRVVFFIGLGIIILLSLFYTNYQYKGVYLEYQLLGSYMNLMCAIGYSLILFPFLLDNSIYEKKKIYKLLITLGTVSYPIYLLHNASPKFLEAIGFNFEGLVLVVFSIITTIVFAILFHYFWEKPAYNFGKKLSKRYLSK